MSVHRRAADGGQRWEVRWREGDLQHKQRFANRDAAQRFDAERRLSPDTSAAREGKNLTVDDLMRLWFTTKQRLRPKTLDAYRLDSHDVLAGFGDRLARSVRPSEIRVWVARDRGLSLRRRSLVAMRQAFRMAVADGLLDRDPTAGIPLPRAAHAEMRFLSIAELTALADAAGDSSPLIWLLGTCGLRLGEAAGLQAGDVDPVRRRLRVQRSVTTSTSGTIVGPPKNGHARDVPISRRVLAMLPESDGWLFTAPLGGRLDPEKWRKRIFVPAAIDAGLGKMDGRHYEGMHPHELRHTAASLAIAAGADVKVVQRMLGHASAAITLDLYGHLWDSSLDDVAARLDEMLGD